MNQKVKNIDLVQSRVENLERSQKGFLRPIGKRYGINVFEWKYPNVEELVAFLNGIPFKTVILCPAVVQSEITQHPNWAGERNKLVVFGENSSVDALIKFVELDSAMEWIKENASQFEALVFVADGVNADDDHNRFIAEWKEKR